MSLSHDINKVMLATTIFQISILRKDFEQRLVVEESNKAKKWRAQEQKYLGQLQNFERQLKRHTHESEQREMKLTIKLDQKTAELKGVTDNAVERQQEFDAVHEQLRQERDDLKLERDTWKVEYNKVLAMHEERKEKRKVEMEKVKEEMDLWKAKCATFDDHVREMDMEAHKKKQEYELAVSKNHQLSSQVQEAARQLNAEKQERGQLTAKLTALNHQLMLERETWLADKSNMEHAVADLSEQVQSLQRTQTQADILRGRLQKERESVQQLDRELQSSRELLRSKDEEHKSNVRL